MNLIEALQRWSELEPLRCSLDDDSDTDSLFRVMLVERLRLIDVELHDHGRLEYAVREAIEARGLNWSIEKLRGASRYHARILQDAPMGVIVLLIKDTVSERVSTSSAAHALLLAYIAYLETLTA